MKNQNEEPHRRPKAGDGTQDVDRKDRANWYGKSVDPVPEFLDETQPPNTSRDVPPPQAQKTNNPK